MIARNCAAVWQHINFFPDPVGGLLGVRIGTGSQTSFVHSLCIPAIDRCHKVFYPSLNQFTRMSYREV